MSRRITRREFLVKPALAAAGAAVAGIAAGCQPQVQVVEKEKQVTVEVIKEVTAVPKVKESITLTYNTWWPRMADDLTVVMVCTADTVRDAVAALPEVDEVVVHPYEQEWPHPDWACPKS